ncbi:Receptor L-domain domain-containing protein [Caenorhabditis elegans]|uniref:Receptor L-domain domain-containing protein n=1 Tax=Caenorhabditis elegans TaxID=6239 RepID=O44601_CAEEL|nr:Receptor L-domain domain-containing protein [Caenorhabditis elegans]CCD69536.2 Receptor L-domain domain-containing protein [Caenorhabditis elegans]|eukprot:NP_503644.2 Insulin/EGF-Receptor L Domain protein [Caenorhabditis elegans]
MTESQLKSTFSNMKHLIGSLLVKETLLKSSKFLAGLKSIECGGLNRVRKTIADNLVPQVEWIGNANLQELGLLNLTSLNCFSMEISSSRKMETLSLPNLKNFSVPNSIDEKVGIRIAPSSSNFCISTEEMLNLIENEKSLIQEIDAKYCSPPSPVPHGKWCNSTVTTLLIKEGCTQIFGNLVIDPENEHLVSQLKMVEVIFGGLIIRGTNLTKIDFFGSLKYIWVLDKTTSAILVENNPNLVDFSFPELKIAKSKALPIIVFENNNNALASDSKYCYRFQNVVNVTGHRQMFFDGKSCG